MTVYVNYTIMGREFQAGPYRLNEADEHKRDIQSFEGVNQVFLSPMREPKRQLITEAADV